MPTMIEKAVVEDRAKMVLITIRRKFENVPPEIEQAVLARTDSIALESLLVHAIDSKTLDEFATML